MSHKVGFLSVTCVRVCEGEALAHPAPSPAHFLQVWVTHSATLPGPGSGLVKKLTPGVG